MKINKKMQVIMTSIKAILTGVVPLLCHTETLHSISFMLSAPYLLEEECSLRHHDSVF